jgi:uncharacterized protein YcfJ
MQGREKEAGGGTEVRRVILVLGGAAIALSACASETPEQKHEVGCMAGTLTGAVLGGLGGSLIGGGTGQAIATAAGAVAGGFAGNRLACE